MGVPEHWLAYADRERPPMSVSPVVITSARLAADAKASGLRVEGPFIPASGVVETAERATALAERYGEAIVAISEVLPNVNRVRAIIAGLESDTPPSRGAVDPSAHWLVVNDSTGRRTVYDSAAEVEQFRSRPGFSVVGPFVPATEQGAVK